MLLGGIAEPVGISALGLVLAPRTLHFGIGTLHLGIAILPFANGTFHARSPLLLLLLALPGLALACCFPQSSIFKYLQYRLAS